MKPIDVAMIQQINEVSNIKLSQDHKPMVEQQTISTMVQKEVEVKQKLLQAKTMLKIVNKSMMQKKKVVMSTKMVKKEDMKKRTKAMERSF